MVAIPLKDLAVGHFAMSQAASMKKLDILTAPAFKDRVVSKAKGIGIYNYMIGEPKKCCFTMAVAAAVEEKKRGEEVKAILRLDKAVQEMLNFIWDSLHPFDKERVKAERLNDELPKMWLNLQIKPDRNTLNQLLQSILKLECERDVPKFVDLFKQQQERLHECE